MFQDLLKNIRNSISAYNQKQPSVIGNMVTGRAWNEGIKNFGGKLAMPIPQQQFEDNNNKALQSYYNREALKEAAAKTPSSFTPKTVKTPNWMANAPMVDYVPTTKTNYNQIARAKLPSNPFLEQNIFPVTDQAGVPRQLAASQWAVESGRNTNSPINNYFGLGPNIKYPSTEANVNDYVLTLKNILKSKGLDIRKLDALRILQGLQQGKTRYEGHNTDPNAYVRTVTTTPEWRMYE